MRVSRPPNSAIRHLLRIAGLSALSYVLAIASRPSDILFWIVSQEPAFPIMLVSGILLPVDAGLAGWLAEYSPRSSPAADAEPSGSRIADNRRTRKSSKEIRAAVSDRGRAVRSRGEKPPTRGVPKP